MRPTSIAHRSTIACFGTPIERSIVRWSGHVCHGELGRHQHISATHRIHLRLKRTAIATSDQSSTKRTIRLPKCQSQHPQWLHERCFALPSIFRLDSRNTKARLRQRAGHPRMAGRTGTGTQEYGHNREYCYAAARTYSEQARQRRLKRGSAAKTDAAVGGNGASSSAASSSPAVGRGRGGGRGRGRGGGRGGKRKRANSEEVSDDANDSDVSNSYTPLPSATRSGRAVNKPTQYVPTLPSPSADSAKKRRKTNRKPSEASLCKICLRARARTIT